MVSNRLSKVHKHIVKKKGPKPNLHEGSRDTQRLQSASAKDSKINRLASIRQKQNKHYLLRVKNLQSYTLEHTAPCTIPEMQRLIEDYLGRDDEEIAKLEAERRAGRPPSTRETLLKQNQATEQGEYVSGFWVPDLEDETNLIKLRLWNGQWQGLSTVKFVRITKSGVRLESSFPPKGMS